MAMRSAVLSTPTHIMALGHPFYTPAYVDPMSVPIGIDARSRELVYGDPWIWKELRRISGGFGLFIGPRGVGKSATMKILAIRFLLMTAGYEVPRVAINDYKPEGSSSEYYAFTQFCRSTVFTMANMSVNPFESVLFKHNDGVPYELGILGMAEILCEFGKRTELFGHENTALRIAMYNMLACNEVLWTPHHLSKLFRSISDEQIESYYDSLDQKLETQLKKRLSGLTDPTIKGKAEEDIRKLVSARNNHRPEDIKSAGDALSTYLDDILEGVYGSMIGDKHSLYALTTQRASTRDWRGMKPEPETLMRTIMTSMSISAIETNQFNLLPHLEIDDEKHKAMDNPVYAKTHSYESEIARATHKSNISGTHRLDSIRKGDVGSELYRLGDTIINNLGFVFIGRQNNVKSVLDELQARYALSNGLTRLLTNLPDYHFVMKLGELEPARVIKIFATPTELTMLATDSATERMNNRPDIMNPEQLKAYGDANGIAYVGQGD
jgi:hypothetical protein